MFGDGEDFFYIKNGGMLVYCNFFKSIMDIFSLNNIFLKEMDYCIFMSLMVLSVFNFCD